MSGPDDTELGFAADYDAPIPYLQRIRDYYQELGYGAPYAGRITPRCRFSRSRNRWRFAALR